MPLSRLRLSGYFHVFFLVLVLALGAVPAGAKAEGLLWRVQSEKHVAWLWGSIHFGRPDMNPLPPAARKAFNQSPVLVVEADVTSPESMRQVVDMYNLGLLPAGDELKRHLSPRTMAEIQKQKVDLVPLNRFRPWLAAISLEAAALQRAGLTEDQGVDIQILKMAKNTKTIKELEGMKAQMEMFTGMSAEEQEQLLYHTLLSLPRLAAEMDQMMDAWEQGDVEAMTEMVFGDLNEHPDLEPMFQRLFGDRNRLMADRIESYLETGPNHFVVVGAGHLLGPEGLPALLERKGFKVARP